MKLLGYLEQLKDILSYDADREFYAKVFPGSVERKALLRLRRMKYDDLAAILAIEQQVYNYPWSEGIFKDCFTAGYRCWVCEDLENILGYCILSLAAGEAHIMNICVDPQEQKQGVGRKMLEHMLDYARLSNSQSIFLEVRPSNAAAIALYDSMGFNEIGTRKGYYPGENGREDALMLAMDFTHFEA